MPIRFFRLCAVIVLSALCSHASLAQTYPSALVTVLQGPRTLFLDEYTDALNPKIRTTIYFTDFSESSWTFNLRLKITGPNGIVIQSKPGSKAPLPFTVVPGQPYVLEGADLSHFFNYNNLNFTGISRTQLEQNNRLPEGLYTFCFEAVDYQSDRVLSHPACASAYLSLNDPPLIIQPVCGSVVENISIQNVLMQWQLSNATGNLNLSQISYQIDLYEVNNAWSNPQIAIINNQALPIWQSPILSQNFYLYGISEPPLEKGKRYVFTVKASVASGRNSFKNNGVSMPCHFHYGYYENDSIPIVKPVDQFQFSLSTPSQFIWKKPAKALSSQLYTYTLKLVELQENQDPETALLNNLPFYQQEYLPVNNQQIDKTIPVMFWMNVKRMGKYAWQVKAQSGTQLVAKSPVYEFTGPPAIENFYAGGFLMTVNKLNAFDTLTNIVSGTCRTVLHPTVTEQAEFAFNNITLSSIGINEWVMSAGLIADKLSSPVVYSLAPKTIPENKTALFTADSVVVDLSSLKLSGKTEWKFPLPCNDGQVPKIVSARNRLTLANSSFYLSGSYLSPLSSAYQLDLLEPRGFRIKLNQNSTFDIYQSKFELSMNGFVELPSNVKNLSGGRAHAAFNNAAQLFYHIQSNATESEIIRYADDLSFGLQPGTYTLDFSDGTSPGEFASKPEWKGLYVEKGIIEWPATLDKSGQLNLASAATYTFLSSGADTNLAYVDHKGLSLKHSMEIKAQDSLRFNSFHSSTALFKTQIRESEVIQAHLTGKIMIPLLDTAQGFPYFIELSDFGFSEGYLKNGLSNYSFTFNPAGGAEEKIKFLVKKAVFKGRNRLELDADLSWPYFDLNIPNVQRLNIWGNGNIGFDVPNGKAAVSYQGTGKTSNFDITVDYLGCGRNGNAYAFGASAKINLDEEISGETGPPVINAYSICKNPLLSGTLIIPTGTTTAPSSGTSTPHVSSTAGYSNALNTGFGDALTQLGFQPGDTATNLQSLSANPPGPPLLNGNTIMQIKEVIDIVYRLKPFIKSEAITERDWQVLDRFRNALSSDVVQQATMVNGKQLLNFILNKVVESVIAEINGQIQQVSDKAMGKVRGAINDKVVGPVNTKIDKTISSIFEKLQQKILTQVDEQYHVLVKEAFATVKINVVNGIKTSVSASFENNITSKITDFVQLAVTVKVKSFVSAEVATAASKLIKDGAQANINLNNVLSNAGVMFTNIADTVKDVIMNMNGANFLNTAESLVEDAIAGIDWNAIGNQILNDLLVKGLTNAAVGQITQLVGANAGPYAQAILSTVKFDFSNLGEKLKKGEFDKVVKFDPTNIYLTTPAVDVRGSLEFKKDDPVFGDSWQADVLVRVKVPKKDNPIECSAFFLNGKTTQAPQNFSYWFVKLGVKGLNIPLNPSPVIWDGAEGFAYSKMKKTGETSVLPDKTNKFGVGCKFFFYDQPSSGKTYIFALGAEADFNEGGFAIQLVGEASVLNFQKTTDGQFKSPGFVTGTGVLGYYKTPECSKIAGNFTVKLNTEPIICAGGDVGLDLKSPQDWKVWVGTQQNPIGVKILCKDFLSNTAFMQAGNSGFTTGMNMNVSLNAQSPWIETSAIKVRGYASMQFGYSAFTSIEWDPTFKINEASISAWLNSNIGIQYETAAVSSSLTLAGVCLSGSLIYKSQPDSEIHGEMAGQITVIGYSVGFNTPVHYSLSKKEIIN